MIRRLHAPTVVAGATSISLTFVHPAMWAPVGGVLGLVVLLLTAQVLGRTQTEPRSFFIAAIWIATTVVIGLAYGLTEELYNIRQLILLVGGLLFGYFLSLRPVPAIAAWTPFCAFAAYFSLLLVLGKDPNEVFARNSQNYISVILLALYASAVIATRPQQVRPMHVIAACVALLLSIWAAGRGGILSSLLLTGAMAIRLTTQRRSGVSKVLVAVFALIVAVIAVYFAADYLDRAGYLYKFEGRGLRDPSRLTILQSYFDDIRFSELLFGRNYYDDSVIGRWGFNLHNSYLDAWAHLGALYLLFIVATLALLFARWRRHGPLAIAVLAFAVRATTDSQLLSGQFDFVFLAALFVLLRGEEGIARRSVAGPSPKPVEAMP